MKCLPGLRRLHTDLWSRRFGTSHAHAARASWVAQGSTNGRLDPHTCYIGYLYSRASTLGSHPRLKQVWAQTPAGPHPRFR